MDWMTTKDLAGIYHSLPQETDSGIVGSVFELEAPRPQHPSAGPVGPAPVAKILNFGS